MKKVFIIPILIIRFFALNGQSFQWAFGEGAGQEDHGSQVAYDQNGNIYTVGIFVDTVDFDPGPGTFNLISYGTSSADIFIQKLDKNGNMLWAKSLTGFAEKVVSYVTTDHFGNLYLTGYFYNTCDFDPQLSVHYYMTSTGSVGNPDVFVLKLNSMGILIWVKQIGGLENDIGRSIVVDPASNVYVSGSFSGAADFDPGPGTYNLTPTSGATDSFILKLSPGGGFVWAKQLKSDYLTDNARLSYCSNNLYLSGYFKGNLDVDPGTGITTLSSSGNTDIFVAKYDDLGGFLWAKQFGSSYNDFSTKIITDETGNVFVAGQYGGDTDFDPGAGVYIGPYYGDFDCFFLKLNTSGNFEWVSTFGGTGTDQPSEITRGTDGSLYLTGYFYNSMNINTDSAITTLSSNGQYDAFILKLNNSGHLVWGANVGGSDDDFSSSVTIDNESNLYVTGRFNDVADFDPGPSSFDLTANGFFADAFVLKLGSDYVGISEINSNNNLSLFPNPASDFININWDNTHSKLNVTIYSMQEELIYSQQFQQASAVINTGLFANGVYTVSFQSGQKSVNKRLVIQHE